MTSTTEAFSRVKIDALLADAGWDLTDGTSVLSEHALGDGSRADYVLCDRAGRPMAVVEAKRTSVDPITAQAQGRRHAEQLEVPFVFLSNGEVWFLDRDADAHARPVATFYSQEDLERQVAARAVRRTLADVPIDRRIVDRGYHVDCVETLSDELTRGQRKLFVEPATGTGKARAAAALINRLFEARAITRVLLLPSRSNASTPKPSPMFFALVPKAKPPPTVRKIYKPCSLLVCPRYYTILSALELTFFRTLNPDVSSQARTSW